MREVEDPRLENECCVLYMQCSGSEVGQGVLVSSFV